MFQREIFSFGFSDDFFNHLSAKSIFGHFINTVMFSISLLTALRASRNMIIINTNMSHIQENLWTIQHWCGIDHSWIKFRLRKLFACDICLLENYDFFDKKKIFLFRWCVDRLQLPDKWTKGSELLFFARFSLSCTCFLSATINHYGIIIMN